MNVVAYFAGEQLHRAMGGGKPVRAVATISEGRDEIRRLLSDYPVTGYNEEGDYWWGRKVGPTREGRLIYRIEP